MPDPDTADGAALSGRKLPISKDNHRDAVNLNHIGRNASRLVENFDAVYGQPAIRIGRPEIVLKSIASITFFIIGIRLFINSLTIEKEEKEEKENN